MPTATHSRVALDLAWFDAIPQRVSRRRFDGRLIPEAVLSRIDERCRIVESEDGTARPVLVRQADQSVFTGFVGSYGRVQGSPSLIAFVGTGDCEVDAGYVGQAMVLHATSAGLDTCWVAGSFDARAAKRLVDLRRGERIVAVSPLGYATPETSRVERLQHTLIRPRARLPLERIAPGSERWPHWAVEAAKAVRLAPSGVNRQPWRMRMESDALVISAAPKAYWTAPIDCGIAMLHAELGALHAGVQGDWERLPEPDIAVFTPVPRS